MKMLTASFIVQCPCRTQLGGTVHLHQPQTGYATLNTTCTALRLQRGRSRLLFQRLAASTSSSSDVQDMLSKAQARYEEGDRYQALKLWEQALKQKPSKEQRQQALYGATCIHASFGDVEVAQTTLRDGIDSGLDFEKALDDPSMPKMSSPTQVLIQLKKFSSARKRMKAAMPGPGSQQGSEGPRGSRPGLQDASKAQRSEEGDMDTSPMAIVKRVAAVVSVLVFAGVVMFLLALKFSFPELI